MQYWALVGLGRFSSCQIAERKILKSPFSLASTTSVFFIVGLYFDNVQTLYLRWTGAIAVWGSEVLWWQVGRNRLVYGCSNLVFYVERFKSPEVCDAEISQRSGQIISQPLC